MLNENVIEKILDYVMSHGGDFGEIYYEETVKNQISMFKETISKMSSGCESGIGIRIFKGWESCYLYSNDCREEKLYQFLKTQWNTQGIHSGGHPVKLSLTHAGGTEGEMHRAALQEKVALLQKCNQAGFDYSDDIFQMNSSYLDMDQNVLIANTNGCFVQDRRRKTRLYIRATAKDGKDIRSSYTGPGAMAGFEFYETISPMDYARKAAESAEKLLHARPCPTGRMPVVIDNGFGGLFFHEACGHSLEAKAVADGASEFAGKLGQRIATEKVTLIDDGTLKGEWGSLHVDDEGTPAQKNLLIEKGVLKGYLLDQFTAKKMGMQATGSARRETYRYAPTARMTNTYIAPGTDHRDEMIGSIERGLYVKNIHAGSVNSITGEFNFNTNETFLIENGTITTPVHDATLIGTGSTILQKVEMVGDDFEMCQGFCYASSGALYIGVGQPTVKLSEITVGGDEVC